jgi:hypothetical protein
VRSWFKTGVLPTAPGTSPLRADLIGLAHVKRAVDLLTEHGTDQALIVAVIRGLSDDTAGSDDTSAELEDFGVGKLRRLNRYNLDVFVSATRRARKRPTST